MPLAQLHPRRLFGTLDEVGHLESRVDQLQTRVHQLVAAHETTEKTATRSGFGVWAQS